MVVELIRLSDIAKIFLLILCLVSFVSFTYCASEIKISGTINSKEGNELLRAVTVLVSGTKLGTFTNSAGEFSLNLPKGKYTLQFSLIGYEKDSLKITLNADTAIVIKLKQSSVITSSLIVVAETPGERIMRHVIDQKEKMRDSLKNYSYMLYTKFVATTDTSTAGRNDSEEDTTIVGIIETYSRGYYRAPDDYYNNIIQKRQSANITPQANFTVFGNNINVYDDYVKIFNDEIYTPFHPKALDFYKFILDTITSENRPDAVCRIIVQPESGTRRLFSGVLHVDTTTYTPVDCLLEPNDQVQLPFDAKLKYRQEFQLVDGFTVPKKLDIYSTLSTEILWLVKPRLDLKIQNYSWNYQINTEIPDDFFERKRVESAKSAADFDTTFWKSNNFINLTDKERLGYRNISRAKENPDSVYRSGLADKVFGPVTRQIAKLSRKPFTGIGDIFIYNRVQGAALGFGLKDFLTDDIEGSLRLGYGFADKRSYADGTMTIYLDSNQRFSFSARGFRCLERSDNNYIVPQSAITIISLLNKSDYGDYYYAAGFETAFEAGFGQERFISRGEFDRPTKIRIFFKSKNEENAYVNTKFSILKNSEDFRLNPPIIEGKMNTVGMRFNYEYNELRRLEDFGFFVQTEFSNPKWTGSDFDFSLFRFGLIFKTTTLPIWTLDLRVNCGLGTGKVPPQKFFSLESSFSGIAAQVSFRGMETKEFYGNRFVTVSAEHNFGELFPGLIKIPNIASFGINFILFANYGWCDFSRDANFAEINGKTYVPNSTAIHSDPYYLETGIGLAQLLIFLRLDVGARLTQTSQPQFFWTISLSGL